MHGGTCAYPLHIHDGGLRPSLCRFATPGLDGDGEGETGKGEAERRCDVTWCSFVQSARQAIKDLELTLYTLEKKQAGLWAILSARFSWRL
jgi:hypothetical protein